MPSISLLVGYSASVVSGPAPVGSKKRDEPSAATTSGAGCPAVQYSTAPEAGSTTATQTVAACDSGCSWAYRSRESSASWIGSSPSSRSWSTARS